MVEVTLNDTSWVDYVTLAATVVLAVFAVVAAVQVSRQIRHGQRQHSEQLRASLRPIVVIPHAEALPSPHQPAHQTFTAWIQNIGVGPALPVEIRGWIKIPSHGWDEPGEREAEIEKLKLEVDIEAPELRGRFGGMPASERPSRGLLVPQVDLALEDYAAKLGVLIYVAIYQDVFENTVPSKPKAEWKLGHIEMGKPGNWSN